MNKKTYLITITLIAIGVYSYLGFLFYTNIKVQKETIQETSQIIETKIPVKQNYIKIIQEKQPRIDPLTAKEISTAVEKYAEKFNLPPELIICIIERESSFSPLAVSTANCVGLMQINEKFHKEKLKKLKIQSNHLFYIDHNIHIGCMILREYYNKTKTIAGALDKYIGMNHLTYKYDILSAFTDLMILKNNFQ